MHMEEKDGELSGMLQYHKTLVSHITGSFVNIIMVPYSQWVMFEPKHFTQVPQNPF